MTVPHDFSIRTVPWDDPAATALRDAQQAELRDMYSGDAEPGVKPTASDVSIFLVMSDAAGQPIGCGGLRPLDQGTGEIKRMFVVQQARGQRLAAVILTALEEQAVQLGWRRLRLETGHRQQAAVALYTRQGYRPIPAFGSYIGSPTSLCFEKELSA